MTIHCPSCGKSFDKSLFPLGPHVSCPFCAHRFDLAVRETVPYGSGGPEPLSSVAEASPPEGVPKDAPAAAAPAGARVEAPDAGIADAEGHPALKAGDQLGSYILQREIGRGGMGVVWLATQTSLDRAVAVKVLRPALSRDAHFLARFDREARSLAALSHPNIVAILDRGHDRGYFYFVMEFVDGTSLRTLMDEGSLAPEEALRIVPQICEALEFAHSRGIVHRDIKPENILRDRAGTVKIADFGLSRIVAGDREEPPLTRTNVVMGTVDYMAPEQRERSKAVDHRADIYSLGVVLYEMLTGELPLGRFDPPSRRNVRVDVNLDRVVLKVLEKDPELRYQRASHVATDLKRASEAKAAPAGGEPWAWAGFRREDLRRGAEEAARRAREGAPRARSWLEENWDGWVLAGVMVFFFYSLFSCHALTGVVALVAWGIVGGHMKKRRRLEKLAAGIPLSPAERAQEAAVKIQVRVGEQVAAGLEKVAAGGGHANEPPAAAASASPTPPLPVPDVPRPPRLSFLALLAFLVAGTAALPLVPLLLFRPEVESLFAGWDPAARQLALLVAVPAAGIPLLGIFLFALASRARLGGRPELRGATIGSLAVFFSMASLAVAGLTWSSGLDVHRRWQGIEASAVQEGSEEPLRSLLATPASRRGASRVIGTLPHDRALELLEGFLATSQDPRARAAAADSLGRLTGARTRAGEILRALLSDPSPVVRTSAASALGRLGGAGAVRALAAAARDAEGDLQAEVVPALGLCGAEGARELASLLAGERSPSRAEEMLAAIERAARSDAATGGVAAEAAARRLGDSDRDVREAAVEALLAMGPGAADAAAARLSDPDWRVRYNACVVLGQAGIGDPARHLPALQQMRRDSNRKVASGADDAYDRLRRYAR
ncbi:MAG: protein kinase [Planctomycetales bacterium]|nr:protein kinase [Planctomycetales bacterium]